MKVKLYLAMLTLLIGVNASAVKNEPVTDFSKPIVRQLATAEFSVRLTTNATTGYQWFLQAYDSEFVRPLNQRHEPAKSKLEGASGSDVWRFRLRKRAFIVPMMLHLRWEYRRPWEVNEVKRKALTVLTLPTLSPE